MALPRPIRPPKPQWVIDEEKHNARKERIRRYVEITMVNDTDNTMPPKMIVERAICIDELLEQELKSLK